MDDPRPLPEGWEYDCKVRFFRAQLMEIIRRDFMTAPLWGAKDPRSVARYRCGSGCSTS